MPYPAYLAGQRITAAALAESDLIGRVIFKATRDTVQSISSNVTAQAANALSWETVSLDLLGGWAAGSPTRWTCPKSAYYTLIGGASFAGSAAGTVRGATWLVNGAATNASGSRLAFTPSATANAAAEARTLSLLISAGSFVELVPVHDHTVTGTPTNLNTGTGAFRPHMEILYGGTV